MASVTFNTAQKAEFTIAPADADGNAKEVENFEVDLQGADLTFDYDEATKVGHIISGSTTGTFPILFKADAKVGEGENLLNEQHEVTIEAAPVEATTLTGTFGTISPKA